MTFQPDIGLGTVILFQTGFFAKIESVNINGEKRDAIDITNMSSTHPEYIPSRLIDAGEMDVTILFDPDKTPPIGEAAETITVKFPIPAGKTNPAQVVATGFMTENSMSIPVKDKMMQTCKIKFTGARVYTAAS